jgi:hypothetical protein
MRTLKRQLPNPSLTPSLTPFSLPEGGADNSPILQYWDGPNIGFQVPPGTAEYTDIMGVTVKRLGFPTLKYWFLSVLPPGAKEAGTAGAKAIGLIRRCAPSKCITLSALIHDCEYQKVETLMPEEPIYKSECTARSLWQKYEIFSNRLEFHTHLGNLVIPFDQVEGAEIYPPVLKSLRVHLIKCLPLGLKLDTADFFEHIVLDKKTGFMRHVLFTPENPQEFKAVLEEALEKFRREKESGAE